MSDLPQVSLSGEVGIPPGNMSVSLINEGVCVCPCTRVGVWVCMCVCKHVCAEDVCMPICLPKMRMTVVY